MDYKSDGFEECFCFVRITICYLFCGFLNSILYLVFKLMILMYLFGFIIKRIILYNIRNSYIFVINLFGKSFFNFII